MHHQRNNNNGIRQRAISGAIIALLVPLAAWSGAHDAPGQSAAADDAGDRAIVVRPAVFSVINLSVDTGSPAYLNERGQVAFNTMNTAITSGAFFDGERVRAIGALGGNYSWVQGVNNQGVVVGEAETLIAGRRFLAFAWTAAGGMRALPGDGVQSSARGVNDRNAIVGWSRTGGINERAVRWNADGTVTALGPAPGAVAEAYAINDAHTATGFADLANGAVHGALWDRNGAQADLGTLGGERAVGMYINKRDDVAGESEGADGVRRGFFWSRGSGMVPINVNDAGVRLVAGMNDRGEVVGRTDIGGRTSGYLWSLGSGLVQVPSGTAIESDVFDINNRGEMVGSLTRPTAAGGGTRAVRWLSRSLPPADLNLMLHRPPAGLVLEAGVAINDAGVMLANSNAGMVLLRPGVRGTDAPVLGPIGGVREPVIAGQDLALTVGFVDGPGLETHTASVTSTDGCPLAAPRVSALGGVGQVRLQHRFCIEGVHLMRVRVTDSSGRATDVQRYFMVFSPGLGALGGTGSLANGAATIGREYQNVPLKFTLWAPLGGALLQGQAQAQAGARKGVVHLSGPFQFQSDQVKTTATAGQQARLEGSGRLNGRDGYRFVLDAADGGAGPNAGADRLRVRVTHVDPASGAEVVDYDNGAPGTAGVVGLTGLAGMAGAAAGADRTVVRDGELTLRN